jgi:uncharacterized protein (TIGR02597 family)
MVRHLSQGAVSSLSFALFLVGTIANAQEVATDPVGYQRVSLTAAASASQPGGSLIGCPLTQPAAAKSGVTSVSGSSVACADATWTAGQFASAPHFVTFRTGTNTGRSYLITANTATELSVATEGDDLAARVASGDSVDVTPAWTLGTLFGSGTVPFLTGTSAAVSDNVLLWSGSSFVTYFHDGIIWRSGADASSKNDTVIYPDEGMFIIRRTASALNVELVGAVPATDLKTKIQGTGSNIFTTRFPAPMTLAALGLDQLPGWQKSENLTLADRVLVWGGGNAWETYWNDGTGWRKAGSPDAQDAVVLPSGTAFYLIRQGTPGQDQILSLTRPYSL